MTNYTKTMIAILGVVTLALGGCASTQGNVSTVTSDEQQIAVVLAKLKTSWEQLDVDAYLALLSDNFEVAEADDEDEGGKEALGQGLKMAIDQGYFDGIVIDIENAKIAIEGASAKVTGVIMDASFGRDEMDLALEKEGDGVWRIVGGEEE